MAFLVKKGSFVAPTTAGNYAVTGVGFQGKALILWTTGQSATGYATDTRLGMGFAVSSTQRYANSFHIFDNSTASTANTRIRTGRTDRCILITNTGGEWVTADFVSWDSDGFTLNFGTTDVARDVFVHYMVLGGTDLTNVYVGSKDFANLSTEVITGVGFTPDCVMWSGNNTNANVVGGNTTANWALGAFTGTQAGATSFRDTDASSPSLCTNYQRTDKAVAGLASTSDAVNYEGTLASMDSDGFTLSMSTPRSGVGIGFLALKGGQYNVGNETQKTSTGTKAKTGVGFQPSGLFLFGANATASSSLNTGQAKISIGGSDGTTEGCAWGSSTDSVTTLDANQAALTDKIIRHATNPSTTDAEADLSSFDSDGYTLNWTTADATAREFIAVAFGSAPETFLVKKGTITAPAGTGSQAYTGVGFQPKAMIFFLSKQTATGFAVNRALSVGWTDGTNQLNLISFGNDGATSATNVCVRYVVTDTLVKAVDYAAGSATTDIAADIVSFDSDGFTLNWAVASPGNDYLVHYIAFGGADLTNAFAGTLLSPATTTGNQAYTGFGFRPDFIMLVTIGQPAVGSATGSRYAVGMAASPTQRGSVFFQDEDTINTSTGSLQVSTQALDYVTSAGAAFLVADLTSFDADGVTLNWSTVQATQRIVGVFAMKGGKYWVGTDNQKTSTGTQPKTGVGFAPAGLMLWSVNAASSASYDGTVGKLSVGASDGTTEGAVWGQSIDNVATSDENQASVTDKVIRMATSPSTTDAEADLSSLDADGYTLNWTTADGTAREMIAVAFGSEVAPQILSPSADSVDGAWTDDAGGTSLFAAIDETSASDADYIKSELDPTNSGCRVKLATGTDPASSSGHIIHWRIRKDQAAGDTTNMTVTLRQGGGDSLGGGTQIATFTRSNVDGSGWTTYDETLSGAEADAITNYGDLYLEFYADTP